ncbi:hypothetical protein J8273_5147 [Carpediemonas membranifera]|uniref:Uncharacterized protein n=1 Tax=Carpediemonas membranifera TaxID=201153 RepID=A0A8J6BW80_9EUKA|nr:hypothetical protein J8273_5147 [Carpediemonas membranifera]|eukprot:KAG9392166.1 hypothetical protein J8273_5147 [Carpediemonas membranifera]
MAESLSTTKLWETLKKQALDHQLLNKSISRYFHQCTKGLLMALEPESSFSSKSREASSVNNDESYAQKMGTLTHIGPNLSENGKRFCGYQQSRPISDEWRHLWRRRLMELM